MIFGMFLYSVKLKSINLKLTAFVGITKFIFLPFASILILKTLNLDEYMVSIIMLELLVPLALTNVNLASLYNCKAIDVTALVLLSSIFFIPYILFIMQLFGKL
jgi:predicted permease